MMNIISILIIAVIVMSAIIFHEVAHGWVANQCGDPTAKEQGRLSLNPLKHIDPIGTVLIPGVLIYLRFIGVQTFVFGWAKPVPVNFLRLRRPKTDMIWVGMAGPFVNVVMAISFSLLIHIPMFEKYGDVTALAVFVNLLLAVFNMIPIPPLDGSRLVMGLLPAALGRIYGQLERYGILIVVVLLYLGVFEWAVFPVVQFLGGLLGVNFV
ncbi:MAG: site-2 protease family protein [Candidatus Omnitrophica bacterium]|nr:site-2 protease family protein [Candidatus Omnitrophota bacterium]MCB9747708.1 site-2 protease family protein [Candidatus Omnitrophota bacterium]